MRIPPEDIVRTVAIGSEMETRVKGSRFIALAACAPGRAEAENIVHSEKKKHHAATHHCRAWRGMSDPENEFLREDDGEPSGSAGQPILQAIDGAGLVGVVVVVTRYFGGVKLGVGGLTRAYGEATALALDGVRVREGMRSRILALTFDYSLYGRINQVLEAEPVEILGREFGQNVGLNIAVARCRAKALTDSLTEAAAARIEIESSGERTVFPGDVQ